MGKDKWVLFLKEKQLHLSSSSSFSKHLQSASTSARTMQREGVSASAKAGLLFKFENKTFDRDF